MKKLEKLKLTENSEISTSEMKQVVGGNFTAGTCGYVIGCGPIIVHRVKNISRDDASYMANLITQDPAAHWCNGEPITWSYWCCDSACYQYPFNF